MTRPLPRTFLHFGYLAICWLALALSPDRVSAQTCPLPDNTPSGTLDSCLAVGTGFNGRVRTIVRQDDGAILAGGDFTSYKGLGVSRYCRINENGTLDATYPTGAGFNGNVAAIAMQADGKAVVGGYFTTYQGQAAAHIVRLNTDGTRDTSFHLGTGLNDYVLTIAIQADGKILAGGIFNQYQGHSVGSIVRINANGSYDANFVTGTGFNNVVNVIKMQPDGRILVGGAFSLLNARANGRLARLDATGAQDFTFNVGSGTNGPVYALAYTPDNQIYVGGFFSVLHSQAATSLARVNQDGSTDAAFTAQAFTAGNFGVYALDLQADGALVVAGSFSSYGATAVNNIVRLDATGAVDTDLNVGSGFNNTVFTLAPGPSNRLLAGGLFTTYQNRPAPRIARIVTQTVTPTCEAPVPHFSASTACPGAPVAFSNNTDTVGPVVPPPFRVSEPTKLTYLWRFGDGSTSSDVNPMHTYATAGSYTVTLIATQDGCSDSTSHAITVNPAPARPSFTGIGASQLFLCQGDSIVLTTATAAGYLFSTGDTTQSIAVRDSGTFSVQVVSDSGCVSQASDSVHISLLAQTPQPTITASGPLTFCEGDSVVLTSSAADAYNWSTGESTQAITVRTGGSYTVSVTTGNACPSLPADSVQVNEQTVPVPDAITASGPLTFCSGDSVVLTAPTAPRYVWSTGDTTQSITVRTSSIVSVQIGNGTCLSDSILTDTITVTPSAPTPTVTASGPLRFCQGDSVVLTASDSVGLVWTTGENTQSIVVRATGVYAVRVDTGNCGSALSAPVSVQVDSLSGTPTITASGPLSFCTGDSVVLTASPATGYLWSTGDTTQSITVDSSGTFTVQVGNSRCLSDTSASVTVMVNARPAQPAITASGPLAFCVGDSVVLTASDSVGIIWSTGDTTQSITVFATGAYSVRVDTGGICGSLASDSIRVRADSIPGTPTITAAGPLSICSGDSVVLTAPVAVGYLWSTGDTTQSITVSTAGTFTVQVGNSRCLSDSSAPVTVNVNARPAQPTITASGPLQFCQGDSVILTASDSVGIIWSTGDTTRSITVAATGDYSVQIDSGSGCPSTPSTSLHVQVDAIPNAPVIAVLGALSFCQGDSVVLTTTTPDPNTVWSSGDTAASIIVFISDSVSAYYTTPAGCRSASSDTVVTVANQREAQPTLTASGPLAFCSGDSVVLTSSAALGNMFSTGDTTQSITVRASGHYTVVIRSATGCPSEPADSVTVFVVDPSQAPTVTVSGDTSFCAGGSVTLTSSAPAGNVWSTGDTTQSITVDSSGSYSVRVVIGACQSDSSAPVTVNVSPGATPPAIAASGATSFCQGDSVVLTATGAAGTTILWSTGDTTQSITVGSSGSYSAIAQAAGGCVSAASDTITVQVNPIPAAPAILNGNTTFCQGGSVVLTSSDSVGNLWSTGDTTQSITVDSSGTYSVRAVVNGCSSASSDSVQVNVLPAPATPSIVSLGQLTYCAGDSIQLTLSVVDTVITDHILWSTGDTTRNIIVHSAGTYTVQVSNATGCLSDSSAAVAVNVSPLPDASFTYTYTFTPGVIFTVTANDTLPGVTYQWIRQSDDSTVSDSSTLITSVEGVYTLIVTSPGGCVDSTNQLVAYLAVAQRSAINVSLMPNPARENVKVQVAGTTKAYELQMLDAKGISVYTETVAAGNTQARSIPVSHLPVGLYMVQITDQAGHRWQGRVAVQ